MYSIYNIYIYKIYIVLKSHRTKMVLQICNHFPVMTKMTRATRIFRYMMYVIYKELLDYL